MQLRVKRLRSSATLPARAHPADAGLDLHSAVDLDIPPGETRLVGTGAGGGTIARALADTSAEILLLERGDFVPQEPENWDPEAETWIVLARKG